VLDPDAHLVSRGCPLTVDGLLRYADATRRRYSRAGRPFVAVPAEVTFVGWDIDAILSGSRLRTRWSYAAVAVERVVEAGFDPLVTFGAPHYSVVLPSYTDVAAQRLIEVLRGQGQSASRHEGAVTDYNDVTVTLPADVNQVDETGSCGHSSRAPQNRTGCVPAS
jgi:hypothetical protein